MKLLYVEDDPLLGKAVSSGLKSEHAVDWVKTGEDARLGLETAQYDLVVLDINLPGMSGLDLLQDLRQKGDKTPVLLLTARDTVSHRVEGLDAGGDDYLVKPFDLDELLARIRALSRRAENYYESLLAHGEIELDLNARSITRAGKTISLSRIQFDILALLLQNTGRYFSKYEIEEKIYGWDEVVESNTIEVHISALRKKTGKDFIKNARGIGYVIENPDTKNS